MTQQRLTQGAGVTVRREKHARPDLARSLAVATHAVTYHRVDGRGAASAGALSSDGGPGTECLRDLGHVIDDADEPLDLLVARIRRHVDLVVDPR